MILSFLHRFRVALASSVGVAFALAVTGGIFLSFKVDPTTLSLADRIDPERAQLFVRTTDPEILLSVIDHFGTVIGDSKPGPENLKVGDLYEFAVLESASGSHAWVLDIYNTSEGDATTVSATNEAHFLPLQQRRSSLAFSPLFSKILENNHTIVWFKTGYVPLPPSPASDLLRSAMGTATEGLAVWEFPTEGTLFLRGPTITTSAMMMPHTADNNPRFWLAVSNPAALLDAIGVSLAARNPTLAEGIRGILQAKLHALTGRTDLQKTAREMLAGPLAVAFDETNAATTPYVLMGNAVSSNAAIAWLQALKSQTARGTIRTMQFYDKENSRTDVQTETETPASMSNTRNGWTLQGMGSGSSLESVTAFSGRKYLLSNNLSYAERTIDAPATSTVGMSASLDIPWTLAAVQTSFPFLSRDLRTIVEIWLGAETKRLSFDALPISGGLRINWVLEY